MKKRSIALSGLLLLAAVSSMAMSLGRHSGAALIGRPLDISVQAVLEAQSDAASLCLEADVFYGDSRLDKSRFSVTLEKSPSSASQALVRIRSAVPIDEPVVTLYLRAGCLLKTERRYVTFAELAPDAGPERSSVAASPAPVPFAAPVAPTVMPPADAAPPIVQSAPPKVVSPTKRNNLPKPAPVARLEPVRPTPGDAVPVQPAQTRTSKPSSVRAPVATKVAPIEAPAKPLLKLEPLELVVEPDAQAKAAAELLEKLQTLEISLRSLQSESLKARAAIDDLNVKLQVAQSERYANPLVYTLATLLLAALAGVVLLLWLRMSGRDEKTRDAPWWRKEDIGTNKQEAWSNSAAAVEQVVPAHSAAATNHKLAATDLDLDLDFADSRPVESSDNRAAAAAKPAELAATVLPTPKLSPGFESSLYPNRSVNAEELFDVQQQADFFVSIAQFDQAIDVLQSHIAENSETSALVYLDLFNLYHQLKRPAHYDSLRVDFNQRFNAEVPTFELYKEKNLGLESYPLALSRIQALWQSVKVLEIIEESLFRRPETSAEAFNLEAYRELLLLYSIAKEVLSTEDEAVGDSWEIDTPQAEDDGPDSRPMSFVSTAIQPLSASIQPIQDPTEGRIAAAAAPDVPRASPRLGLDIDLSGSTTSDDKANSDNLSDSEFFAQFDDVATVAIPATNATRSTSSQGDSKTDDLIDFDAFDVLKATSSSQKSPKA